tara:strand:+ start:12214 stop:13254 length:1041 start_codon:yes stop_codon:yes gene_type:complete
MAIKVNGNCVIDNRRHLGGRDSYPVQTGSYVALRGRYDTFYPGTAEVIDAVNDDIINYNYPYYKKTLTQNGGTSSGLYTIDQVSNAGGGGNSAGETVLLLIDTTTSSYTPTFDPTNFFFPSTPSWASHRYWHVTITNVEKSTNTNMCTAVGFDEPSTSGTTSFDNFSLSAWDTWNNHFASSGFPDTWCYLAFQHQASNNRVRIERAHGDSGAPGTYAYMYANYTGLTGITSVQAQYNVQSQQCYFDCTASNYSFGPLPTNDGYNSGTYYTVPTSGQLRFGWMAQANPNNPPGDQKARTEANFGSVNPDFRITIQCDQGTFYSTGEVDTGGLSSLRLAVNIGSVPLF